MEKSVRRVHRPVVRSPAGAWPWRFRTGRAIVRRRQHPFVFANIL